MNPPAARLEVVAGNAAGTSIYVEDEMVIGRHAEGAGRLAEDEEISRMHARVTLDSSGVCEIEDLGSTNGTYVNGMRISAPEALSVGDTIELGQTTLAVRELPAPPRPSSSKLFFPEEELEEEADAPPAPPTPVPAAPFPEPRLEPEPEADLFDQAAPEPTTAAERSAAPPPLNVRLEVDFINREARVSLDHDAEPVRFVFEAGAWRVAPSPPREEGDAP